MLREPRRDSGRLGSGEIRGPRRNITVFPEIEAAGLFSLVGCQNVVVLRDPLGGEVPDPPPRDRRPPGGSLGLVMTNRGPRDHRLSSRSSGVPVWRSARSRQALRRPVTDSMNSRS